MEKNHLNDSLSPYLQQHATNPVHWYPWGEEALKKAKAENKPILLSIGYSACHWCHVMAHESFEDEATADLMNRLFINIKVDREERPDLDKIYQTSHQLLNQKGGGWPLTVFLNPKNHLPFFSGTYFPRESKYGLPAFDTVLKVLSELYQNQFDHIQEQMQQMQAALKKLQTHNIARDIHFSHDPIEFAIDLMEEEFDEVNGGFSRAPKFPMPAYLNQLLRRYHGDPRDRKALNMLKKTLDNMAMGGIYDQIGGGFFRYSVDEHWEIPHFEKMLYDNAALMAIYAQASVLFKNEFYKTIAYETGNWALKKMRAPEGAFYSTLDADSLGIEGKFYVWDKSEIQSSLTPEEYAVFSTVFNLRQTANFEKQWHLHQVMPLTSLNEHDLALINSSKIKLFQVRKQRISPHKDQKILTSWNALFIRSLSISGFLFQEPRFIEAAKQALYFIKNSLYKDKKLSACYKDKQAYCNAYLDDYAFLIDALICYLQADFDTELLEFAIELTDVCIDNFYDKANAGFYYTSHHHETLIQRPKILMDESLPSGNGIMVLVLNRLGHLLSRTDYLSIAEQTLRYSWATMEASPTMHQSLLNALEEYINPPEFLTLIHQDDADLTAWKKALISNYNPHRICLFLTESLAKSVPIFAGFKLDSKPVAVYLCKGTSCSAPIYEVGKLIGL